MPKGVYKRPIGYKPKNMFKKGDKGFLGFKHSEISKEKMRKNLKGRIPWNKGKKRPEISGKNHWKWKNGITPENEKIRTSLEIKLWKKAILQRDNFTCQKYGIRGGELMIHHINNFADFSELRTSIENGITLSKKAHIKFHRKYGFKHNTREQLEEFLR